MVFVVAVAAATACTRYVFPEPAAPRRPTAVSASAGRTWDAAIEEIADGNAPITQLQRESGYLNTDVVRATNSDADTLAECWHVKHMGADTLIGPTHAFYNIVVRGDSSHATVKVNARFTNVEYESRGPLVVGCVSRGLWERRTEAAIKARAEGTNSIGAAAP